VIGLLRVALIGKSGSGKSEVARLLKEEFGCRVVKTGAICREIAQLLFGNDNKHSTQIIDDALTTIESSIFLRAALRSLSPDESIVIDALRFESDLEIARALGCTVIRVTAADQERVRRLLARGQKFDLSRDGQHRSETELDYHPVDHTAVNEGTIGDLRLRVAEIMTQHLR
jgi:dephospho-CoA kinase